MQVKVTRLGDRDAGVAAAQLGDERPDDGPLLLERVNVAKQHVERQRSYVHEHRALLTAAVPRPAARRPDKGYRARGCRYD